MPKAFARFDLRLHRRTAGRWRSPSRASSPRTPTGPRPRSCAAGSSPPTTEEPVLVEKVLRAEQDGRGPRRRLEPLARRARPSLRRPRRRARRDGLGRGPASGTAGPSASTTAAARPSRSRPRASSRSWPSSPCSARPATSWCASPTPWPGTRSSRAHRGRGPAADLRDRRQRRPPLLRPGVHGRDRRPGPARRPQRLRPPHWPRGSTGAVTFESVRPQVRFVGRGLILPRKDRLTVPFEAVNLRERPGRRLPDLPRQHGPVLPGRTASRAARSWPASAASCGARPCPSPTRPRTRPAGAATTWT
ncbi:MAG: hypothetical protein MZV64_68035 [Ignavibacteriales bacterium]|nr:hypothetical protein [Ignavibacteriales bacterium]